MVLALSVMSVTSFIVTTALLTLYSVFDIRDRRVKNEIILGGLIVGCIVLLLTSHFVQQFWLHLLAIIYVVPLSMILYKGGSIGGADLKVMFTVALLSPGIELGEWMVTSNLFVSSYLLEVALGFGGQLIVMLLGGYLYWRYSKKEGTPPLIPFLFLGYFIIQLLALV